MKLCTELANGCVAIAAKISMFFQCGVWGNWSQYAALPRRAFEDELVSKAPVASGTLSASPPPVSLRPSAPQFCDCVIWSDFHVRRDGLPYARDEWPVS